MLRISMDAKATVAIGPFSRNGVSRVGVQAADHDFTTDLKLTPFGIFLPDYNQLHLYFTPYRVTSDFIADCLSDFWSEARTQFPQVTQLLINQDNGPECHSRRTQFIKRMIDLTDDLQIDIHLAYYPPYHSKYNPIERVFGILENHWNGDILDTVGTALNFAKTMTYNGVCPVVKLVEKAYQTGVSLTQKQMKALEKRLNRLIPLEKWFVQILHQLS